MLPAVGLVKAVTQEGQAKAPVQTVEPPLIVTPGHGK